MLIHCGEGSIGGGGDINNQAITFIKDLGMQRLQIDVDKSDLKEIPDNSFDIVFIADTIEHLESPHKLLINLRDKLKDDGVIIVYVHVLPKYKIWQYFAKHVLNIKGLWSVTHYLQYNFDTFNYSLEHSGFKVKNYFISGTVNYRLSKILTTFLKKYFSYHVFCRL